MNNFDHIRVLGRGGFGAANLVKRKNDGKLFAIKTIEARNELAGMTEKEKETAMKEADVLRDLTFLHIVKYFDAWWEGDKRFNILMEYCEDGSLADVLQSRNGRHFKDTLILDWMIQLGMALKYLHDRNVIHRDVKPENLLLSKKRRLLKLGDFGIVSILQNTNSLTMATTGTPSYMAPEIHKGKGYNYPADVFSVGCVLFELINLKKPYQVENNLPLAICVKVLSGEHESFERNFCREFILKCLNEKPEARPDINDLIEVLTELKLDLALEQEGQQTARPTTNRSNQQKVHRDNTLDRRERELQEQEEQLLKEQEEIEKDFKKQEREIELKLRQAKLEEQRQKLKEKNEQKRQEIEKQKAQFEQPHKSNEQEKIEKTIDMKKLNIRVSDLFQHKKKEISWTNPQILWINDNELILCGYCVGDVVLFTLGGDGHSTKKLPDTEKTPCATKLPDGKFAIGQSNGSVSIWSRTERKQHDKIHEKGVTNICCLPDGGYFTTSFETVATLDRNLNIVSQTETPGSTSDFASSAETVATGHSNGSILVYDTSSELKPRTLFGHLWCVHSLSFRDKLLASGGYDNTVRLWNPSQSDKPALTMKHDNLVKSVKFGVNPTKNNLFSCSRDKTTRMWNVATGQQIAKFEHIEPYRWAASPAWAANPALCLDVDKTGCVVATGHQRGVTLMDPKSPKIIKEIESCPYGTDWTSDLKFSPDGVKCAITQYNGHVRMVDLRY